jgi:hypothetical protein
MELVNSLQILFSFHHTHLLLPPEVFYSSDQAATLALPLSFKLWPSPLIWHLTGLTVRELVYSPKVLFLLSFLPSSALTGVFQGHAKS